MIGRPALRAAFAAALLSLAPASARAQQVQVDHGLRAGGLWCFPLVTEPRTYVYLPSAARLATDDAGRPQFSFVRYVVTAAPAAGGAETVRAAGGGGILHFLVLIDTPAAAVSDAQRALRETTKDPEVTLRGPIVFSAGRYALVSSVLLKPDAPPERRLLASGIAPVLEGNRLAFSFDLTPDQAMLLRQSLQMHTPDVSIVFDMTFAGLNEAYDADLTIDWSEVRRTQAFKAGGSAYFVGADLELGFEEMRRNNAIKLRSSGTDAAMEGLLNTVYAKLLELMFKPVEPERVPADSQGGLVSALHSLVSNGGALGSRKTTGFGLNVAYQLKDLRSSGTSVLNFNHRATIERHSFITFNIGDLYKRYGADKEHFRDVQLDEATPFRQHEIQVGLDGALLPEFDRYINGVTVTLRKRHQNGEEETLKELVLGRESIQKGSALRLVYGWKGDDDYAMWLQYEYRTHWSFKGGGAYQSDWTRSDAPMINLFVPYERRVIQIVGNADVLKKHQVRAVVVEVEYPFFGEQRRQTVVVRPDRPGEEPRIEITLPLGQERYGYVITWQLEGNQRLTRKGQDASGIIFIDELPGS
jgi:hypothetical protein